mgnify:CR=1 FL=1
MKYILIILLLSPALSLAQYGIDGGIVAGAVALSWSEEQKSMRKIKDLQTEILIANTTIWQQNNELLKIERKMYKALEKSDDLFKNTSAILRLTNHSKKLYEITDQTIELVEEFSDLQAIVNKKAADFVLQTGYLFEDIYIALKEGKYNLMNSSERLLFMNSVVLRMDELIRTAQDFQSQVRTVIAILKLDKFDVDSPYKVDYSNIYNELDDNLNEFFKQ